MKIDLKDMETLNNLLDRYPPEVLAQMLGVLYEGRARVLPLEFQAKVEKKMGTFYLETVLEYVKIAYAAEKAGLSDAGVIIFPPRSQN